MLGVVAGLPIRNGGYIIPKTISESDNIITTLNIPAKSRILCSSCSIENEDTLISNGGITKVSNGYTVNKNIEILNILRSTTETPPLSVVNNREILYAINGLKRVTLKLPVSTRASVVYNDEIHILMAQADSNQHYKWDRSKWVLVSTLPYKFNNTSMVVYNGDIHILGGAESGTGTNHYKWDGKTWERVSTIPYSVSNNTAVVYNNEIHVLGPAGSESNTSRHFKWNGTEWSDVSIIPYDFSFGSSIVYNNELHILGGYASYGTNHYKFNGTDWTSVSTLPYAFSNGRVVIYNNELHMLGSLSYKTNHYKWDGSSWVEASTLPYSLNYGTACVYDNEIHLMSGTLSGTTTSHYVWDGSVWKNYKLENAFNLPKGARVNNVLIKDNGDSVIKTSDDYLIEY